MRPLSTAHFCILLVMCRGQPSINSEVSEPWQNHICYYGYDLVKKKQKHKHVKHDWQIKFYIHNVYQSKSIQYKEYKPTAKISNTEVKKNNCASINPLLCSLYKKHSTDLLTYHKTVFTKKKPSLQMLRMSLAA